MQIVRFFLNQNIATFVCLGEDEKVETGWLFPFIYRPYWLPILATPPEDG